MADGSPCTCSRPKDFLDRKCICWKVKYSILGLFTLTNKHVAKAVTGLPVGMHIQVRSRNWEAPIQVLVDTLMLSPVVLLSPFFGAWCCLRAGPNQRTCGGYATSEHCDEVPLLLFHSVFASVGCLFIFSCWFFHRGPPGSFFEYLFFSFACLFQFVCWLVRWLVDGWLFFLFLQTTNNPYSPYHLKWYWLLLFDLCCLLFSAIPYNWSLLTIFNH